MRTVNQSRRAACGFNSTAANAGLSVSEFSAAGTPLSASAYTGGGLAQPTSLAIDASGRVHVANFGDNSLTILVGGSTPGACSTPAQAGQTGCPLSPAGGYTGGGQSGTNLIAIDGAGRSWITNYHGDSITEMGSDGSALSPATGYAPGELSQPYGIAVDASGNLWVANFGSNTVTQFIGIAVPVSTPLLP